MRVNTSLNAAGERVGLECVLQSSLTRATFGISRQWNRVLRELLGSAEVSISIQRRACVLEQREASGSHLGSKLCAGVEMTCQTAPVELPASPLRGLLCIHLLVLPPKPTQLPLLSSLAPRLVPPGEKVAGKNTNTHTHKTHTCTKRLLRHTERGAERET